jgi:hypothetical protein
MDGRLTDGARVVARCGDDGEIVLVTDPEARYQPLAA